MEIKITALVPMKDTSIRVPNKNKKNFAGKPLYTYILQTLSKVNLIDQIIINTDSDEIKEKTSNYKNIKIHDRPHNLRGSDIPMNEIINYDLTCEKATYYIQTHATNPFLQPETIEKAIQHFFSNLTSYDSLFSVKAIYKRYWKNSLTPLNHNPNLLLNTQDLKPIYEENSCIYIFSRESFLSNHNRIGQKPYMFEMNTIESIDIDTQEDFTIAEIIYKSIVKQKGSLSVQ